jgi:hypothetical protein
VRARILLLVVASLCLLWIAQAWGDGESPIKVIGDFRYRHELTDVGDADPRNMHRIRGRLGIQGVANPWLKVVFRISTGSANPTTLMQTLDGGFSDKPISLDLAYFDASPVGFSGVHLMGGKVPYPMVTTPLVWDGDVTPEGLALKLSKTYGTVEPLLNAGFFWVEERASADDSYLIGGQAGAGFKPSKSVSIRVCGGISQYTETEGNAPFYDTANSKGNSVDTAGNYMYDYSEVEAYGEIGTVVGPLPVKVFANYVTNTAADSLNGGLLVGASVGKASKPKSWQISYDYRRLERDGVIGAFTDSDPWVGGTDGENHKVQFVYQIAANTQAGVIYFAGTQGLENDPPSVTKLRVELNFKI